VTDISRDAVNDEKRGLLYTARIHLDSRATHLPDRDITLGPGIAVQAEIERSLARWLRSEKIMLNRLCANMLFQRKIFNILSAILIGSIGSIGINSYARIIDTRPGISRDENINVSEKLNYITKLYFGKSSVIDTSKLYESVNSYYAIDTKCAVDRFVEVVTIGIRGGGGCGLELPQMISMQNAINVDPKSKKSSMMIISYDEDFGDVDIGVKLSRVTGSYFVDNSAYCGMYAHKNEENRYDFIIIKIRRDRHSNTPLDSPRAHECLIRSIMSADGIWGAQDLPFHEIADSNPMKCLKEHRCLKGGVTIDQRIFFIMRDMDINDAHKKMFSQRYVTLNQFRMWLGFYEDITKSVSYYYPDRR
jgi:hypothetical protein